MVANQTLNYDHRVEEAAELHNPSGRTCANIDLIAKVFAKLLSFWKL